MSPSQDINALYGFTPLPADQSKIPPATKSPNAVLTTSIPLPETPLATRIVAYAKAKLPPDTYRHSLRVYNYGCAIARECFPQFNLTIGSPLDETWFLTAMLHDIGTCPGHLETTKLSFEFWGGYHALQILQDSRQTPSHDHGEDVTAPREQAESVAEAIIRHQDVQEKGYITLMTRLIHLGTLLDNIGAGQELVHRDTIKSINELYDRKGWSGCFESTVQREKSIKGWAMVSRIEGFEDAIENNGKSLMKEWEE